MSFPTSIPTNIPTSFPTGDPMAVSEGEPMPAEPSRTEPSCSAPSLNVLPKSLPKPFRVLGRVTERSGIRLSARMMPTGKNVPAVWELLEAMGQAACLHQRLLSGWKRQAMVLAFPRVEFGELGELGELGEFGLTDAGELDAGAPDPRGSDVGGAEAQSLALGEAGERSGALVHVELVAQATSAAAYRALVEDVANGNTRLVCRGEVKVGLMDWPGEDAGHAEACRKRSMEMWRCVLE